MKRVSLEYKIECFDCEGVARHIILRKGGCVFPISASLYEAHLHSRRKPKKGTTRTVLQHVLFLYTWADFDGFDLEKSLFSGKGLQLPDIQRFSSWLDARCHKGDKVSDGYKAHIISDCKCFVIWFVKRYVKKVDGEALNITIYNVVKAHREAWSEIELTIVLDVIAEDMTEGFYQEIESYFKPIDLLITKANPTRLRNYIMWRLAWEFGLRIGEILSLRTVDVNLISVPNFISIVRLDERKEEEVDFRSPYQPKVKTLSRELGFLKPETLLPELIEFYISTKRTRYIIKNGSRVASTFLGHDFLFIVHDGTGRPLSCSAAQKISREAGRKCKQGFNWHLARHSFFNRRYAEASLYSDNSILIDHLIYWGGWKSEESLKRYVRRSIRDIARSGLIKMNKQFNVYGVDDE